MYFSPVLCYIITLRPAYVNTHSLLFPHRQRDQISLLTPCNRVLQKLISHFTGQEIPCLFWNPKVNYCVHMGLPLNPTRAR